MQSQYLKQIYESVALQMGKTKAREYVARAVSSIIYELEESGSLSDEGIEKALKEELELCNKAKKQAVA